MFLGVSGRARGWFLVCLEAEIAVNALAKGGFRERIGRVGEEHNGHLDFEFAGTVGSGWRRLGEGSAGDRSMQHTAHHSHSTAPNMHATCIH